MASKKGIFVYSTGDHDDIIQGCKDLIENSISGGKIEGVIPDDKYGGLKVYLNRNDVVQKFLSERFLLDENGETLASIHPLITQLIVRDAKILLAKQEFLETFKLFIQENFGQFLQISNIPFSERHPDILTNNLKVIFDVPEIEDLDVFKKVGLPDDFEIQIPGMKKRLSLNFYCSICKKGGHTSWSCSKRSDTENALESSQRELLNVAMSHTSQSRSSFSNPEGETIEEYEASEIIPSQKRKVTREKKIGQDRTKKIGQEEIICKGILNRKDPDQNTKKVGESSSSTRNYSIFSDRHNQKREPSFKKARTSLMNNDKQQSYQQSISNASSSDIDIEIYNMCPSTSTAKPQNFRSKSKSSEISIDEIYDVNSVNMFPKQDHSSCAQQENESLQDLERISFLSVGPILIPPRIKQIASTFLDYPCIQQLENFLNHARKKSNLKELVEYSEIDNVKDKLIKIKNAYYKEKPNKYKAAHKEEYHFMRILGSLISRL